MVTAVSFFGLFCDVFFFVLVGVGEEEALRLSFSSGLFSMNSAVSIEPAVFFAPP